VPTPFKQSVASPNPSFPLVPVGGTPANNEIEDQHTLGYRPTHQLLTQAQFPTRTGPPSLTTLTRLPTEGLCARPSILRVCRILAP